LVRDLPARSITPEHPLIRPLPLPGTGRQQCVLPRSVPPPLGRLVLQQAAFFPC
jgi:hypothetical protein